MAVREILRMGNPLLLQQAAAVDDPTSAEIRQLIADMYETMEAANGAGLAAPQVGVPLRLVIFAVEANPRYPEAETVPSTVLINPEIEVLDETREAGWEGCLSIPGMRGLVERPNHIRYRGVDQDRNPIDREATGFHARVVQHECDHLDGILYPFRIRDPRNFGFEDELFKPAAEN
ncbi:MAG: peptide deformylase [Gammaproteobacteria bacterium]|nr:peptide deformylase [Gammaproteobacteria bacterium]